MSELWRKALATADDARLLFQAGRYDSACNRAYYAMFNAARALLRRREIAAAEAKRHSTVWQQFSLHFVSEGTLKMPDGLALARLGEIRNIADYADNAVTASVAESVMNSMNQFMAAAAEVIGATDEGRQP